VTVLVPVRNEGTSIGRLIESIALQQYPADRFELIVVDDGSEDRTLTVVRQSFDKFSSLRSSVISLTDVGSKKAAIEAGVQAARGEWILATDGDTYFGPKWMNGMMQVARTADVKLICGPVIVVPKESSVIGRTAGLESLGLTAIAGAGILSGYPFFCNGANMAYRKSHFQELQGFVKTEGRLSGDDTDLLTRTSADAIRYIASGEVVVRTDAPSTIGGFFSQRQRWASKIPVSLSGRTFFFAAAAWCCHTLLLFSLTGCFGWTLPVVLWTTKVVVEVILLKVSGHTLGGAASLPLILVLQPLYALAVVIVGITAVALPYRWKGRKGH
jgi:cellulose synthase/poly-beta-1,6-N-acetylglucosamine synthase-like glycosyltransferase